MHTKPSAVLLKLLIHSVNDSRIGDSPEQPPAALGINLSEDFQLGKSGLLVSVEKIPEQGSVKQSLSLLLKDILSKILRHGVSIFTLNGVSMRFLEDRRFTTGERGS